MAVETPKYETLVEDNIAQVSQKIRLADLGRGVVALACLVFGYAFCVALLDLSLGGSDAWGPLAIRLVAFGAFLIGLGVLGTRVVFRYLTRVNPFYAARQLEVTIPDSKNSLINWLDLKNETLPPVIRQAVGTKAARDLKDADPDLVATSKDMWRVAGLASIFFLGLIVLLAIVPRQFGSLMARAFMPVRTSVLASQTVITVIKPGLGDITVPANQRVEFLARIEGRFPPPNSPGAPALLFRQTKTDAPVRVPLEEDNLGQWTVRLGPDQIRTGIFWKIIAGDAATPEAQLRVRAQPFVTRVDATYTYRPYRKLGPETVSMPNELMQQPRLLGHRGTNVVLKARVNAPVKAGHLELDLQGVKKIIPAELPASEPLTMVFRLGLDKSGTFSILFDAEGGEKNVDRLPYPIDVLEDGAPFVDLVKPGKDLIAPANGTVLLAGIALDDFGVTGMTLKLQQAAKPAPRPLADLPYVPKFKLKFDDGTYPVALQYVDVLRLEQLRTPDGKIVSLIPGDEITYWLEATDNFDFGRPNVGKSKTFKITIQDNLKEKTEQTIERKKAEQVKNQHDQDQKKEHDKQNDEHNQGGGDSQKKDQTGKNDSPDKNNSDNKDGGNKDDKNKDGGSKGEGDKGQNNSGANNKQSPEDQHKNALENSLKDTATKLDELNKKNNPGNSEPDKNPSSDPGKGDKSPEQKPGSKDQPSPKDGTNESGKEDSAKDKSPKDNPGKEGSGKEGANEPKGDKENPSKAGAENKKQPDGKQAKDGGASESSSDPGKDPKQPEKTGANQGGGDGQKSSKTSPDKTPGDDPAAKKGGDGKDPMGTAKSTDQKGDPTLKEKGPTSDKAKTEVTDKKPDGPVNKGEAKGNDPKKGPEAKTKQDDGGVKNPLEAKAKDGKEGDPANAKELPPNQKPNQASVTKDDGNSNAAPPTKEEIDGLKDLLKKKGPEADAAAKDLAERGQNLKNPELKKALEDILRDNDRKDDLQKLTGGEPEMAPEPKKEGEPGKGPGPMPNGEVAPNQGNEASPKTNSGARGLFDELKAINPEGEFARRLHNLQLENLDELKKRVSVDDLKAANISDGEWQRFLENAKKYQDLMKRIQSRDESKYLRGGASKIANQGPRQVQTNPNAANPETGVQTTPPWEFRDAQERFTRKTKDAK